MESSLMAAKIGWICKTIAQQVRSEVAQKFRARVAAGLRAPGPLWCWSSSNPALTDLCRSNVKRATKWGSSSPPYDLPETTAEAELLALYR